MFPLALYYFIAWSTSLLQAQYVSFDTSMDTSAEFVSIHLELIYFEFLIIDLLCRKFLKWGIRSSLLSGLSIGICYTVHCHYNSK